jgi:hypothetical protein
MWTSCIVDPMELPTFARSVLSLANGNRCWFLDGQLDRSDGPAVERADGTKAWYSRRQASRRRARHERSDESEEWYPDGRKASSEELRDQKSCPAWVSDSLFLPFRAHLFHAFPSFSLRLCLERETQNGRGVHHQSRGHPYARA